MVTDIQTDNKRRCSARLAMMRENLAAKPGGGQLAPAGVLPTDAHRKRRRLVLQWKTADGSRRQASACSSRAVLADQANHGSNIQKSAASSPVRSGKGNASFLVHGRKTAASAGAVQADISNSSGQMAPSFSDSDAVKTGAVRGLASERWLLPRFTGSGGARWSRPDPHCPALGPSAQFLPWPGWPHAPDPLGIMPEPLLDGTSEHHIQCDGCGEWLQVHSQVITIYRKPQNMAFFCRYLTGVACRGDFRNPSGVATKNIPKKKKKRRQ